MQNLRTQIYLPEDLRQEIDRDRHTSGESLAEYLRKAAEQRLEEKRKEKADLKKLAEDVLGRPTISQSQAEKWIREIREERELIDRRLEEKWAKARKR